MIKLHLKKLSKTIRYYMFFFNKKNKLDFIVVGLGNPGDKYKNTRHNVGFRAIDYIASKFDKKIANKKFDSLVCNIEIKNKKILLIKPQTFMNLSGIALEKVMKFYKASPEKVIILLDDINFNVGEIKIKKKGSHGGQNGMRNIMETLDSENFKRIKIGVGKKPNHYESLADWVISKFSEEEEKKLENVFKECLQKLQVFF